MFNLSSYFSPFFLALVPSRSGNVAGYQETFTHINIPVLKDDVNNISPLNLPGHYPTRKPLPMNPSTPPSINGYNSPSDSTTTHSQTSYDAPLYNPTIFPLQVSSRYSLPDGILTTTGLPKHHKTVQSAVEDLQARFSLPKELNKLDSLNLFIELLNTRQLEIVVRPLHHHPV